MSYKAVKAIALGTAALSTGIVHFDPDRKAKEGDDDRYRGGIFPTADALRLEKKKLGQIVGDASEADYKRWQTELRLGGDVNRVAAERVQASVDENEDVGGAPVVSNIETIAHPADTPARAPDTGSTLDPDAAPGASGGPGDRDLTEPSMLDQSVPKLTDALEDIDDVDELRVLLDAEKGGKSRAGALDAINARIAAVEDQPE